MKKALYLTPDGMRHFQTIVRNTAFWEQHLTDAANYAPDHVHDDAGEIEHILGGDTVHVGRQLNFVDRNPRKTHPNRSRSIHPRSSPGRRPGNVRLPAHHEHESPGLCRVVIEPWVQEPRFMNQILLMGFLINLCSLIGNYVCDAWR